MENGKIAPPQQHAPSPGQLADEFVFRLLSRGKEQKFNVFPRFFFSAGRGGRLCNRFFAGNWGEMGTRCCPPGRGMCKRRRTDAIGRGESGGGGGRGTKTGLTPRPKKKEKKSPPSDQQCEPR